MNCFVLGSPWEAIVGGNRGRQLLEADLEWSRCFHKSSNRRLSWIQRKAKKSTICPPALKWIRTKSCRTCDKILSYSEFAEEKDLTACGADVEAIFPECIEPMAGVDAAKGQEVFGARFGANHAGWFAASPDRWFIIRLDHSGTNAFNQQLPTLLASEDCCLTHAAMAALMRVAAAQ